MLDGVLATLGLSKPATIGGVLGAVVSLKLIEGLSVWGRVSTVGTGAITASLLTPLSMEVFSLAPKTEGAIAFLIGVFGMSFAGAVIKAAPEIVTAVKDRFISGGNKG